MKKRSPIVSQREFFIILDLREQKRRARSSISRLYKFYFLHHQFYPPHNTWIVCCLRSSTKRRVSIQPHCRKFSHKIVKKFLYDAVDEGFAQVAMFYIYWEPLSIKTQFCFYWLVTGMLYRGKTSPTLDMFIFSTSQYLCPGKFARVENLCVFSQHIITMGPAASQQLLGSGEK